MLVKVWSCFIVLFTFRIPSRLTFSGLAAIGGIGKFKPKVIALLYNSCKLRPSNEPERTIFTALVHIRNLLLIQKINNSIPFSGSI